MRHPENTNLILHYDPMFEGLPVQTERGPLVVQYLDRLLNVQGRSLHQYGRVFAFRVDLRFPAGYIFPFIDNNEVIDRFFASFKAKIRHNRDGALAQNPYAHDTIVRYVWCREFGRLGIPHYHAAILLNYDAFCTLGSYELGRDNLFNKTNSAWSSSLGPDVTNTAGLVEFPENPFYILHRGDHQAIGEFFYRASYLCKADTKHYGNGAHGFGSSRV